MRDHRTFLLCAPALLLSILLVNGCSRDVPVAPAPLGTAFAGAHASVAASLTGAFFPLAVGNRWHSSADLRITMTPNQGSPETDVVHGDISKELTGTESLFGRTYVVEQDDVVLTLPTGPDRRSSWVRYRQDASGLYEADVVLNQPPGSNAALSAAASAPVARVFPASLAARLTSSELTAYQAAWSRLNDRVASIRGTQKAGGTDGPMPNELTRLSYPLHPGSEWEVRPDPRFQSTVIGAEALNLPAGNFVAWKISIVNAFLAESDYVYFWFGRSGQLQQQYHLVSAATDENGNTIGTLTYDYFETVDRIDLVTP